MNRIHARITAVAILAAFLLAAAPASADFMDFQGVGLNQQVRFHAPGKSVKVPAGQMRINYDGTDQLSYCVDIYATAGDSEVTEAPVLSLHNGDIVAWLYEVHSPDVTTGLEACSIQVAIWEALYETDGNPFDLSSGSFYVSENANAAAGAEALLAAAPTDYDPTGTFVLVSECKQDMLGYDNPPVPEPAAASIMGLGGLFALARRRRRR